MYYNDSLDDSDRCRVFNMYVAPALKNGELFKQMTKTKTTILFSYDFSSDVFELKGIYSFDGLRKMYIKEGYENLFISATNQLNMTKTNAIKSINICIFQYAPRGSFAPSLYKFDKNIKETDINDTIMRPTIPPTTVYNEWFSNKNLKSLINWDILTIKEDVGDDLLVFIINENRKDNSTYVCS